MTNLIYYNQTEFSDYTDQNKPVYGNCLSACLATLMQIDLNKIINFNYINVQDRWREINNFIYSNGYENFGTYYFNHPDRTWDALLARSEGVDGIFIGYGTSPRNTDIHHAVLYKDGELFFDPHIDRSGIVDLKGVHLIEKAK